MNIPLGITGIEVIRQSEAVVARPVDVPAGEKVELTYGNSLHVNVSFNYKGLAITKTPLYGAIGVRGFGFDEKVAGQVDVALPESSDFTPCQRSVDISITADIAPGKDYDLYCKFLDFPGAGMPERDNIIDIVGIPPIFKLLEETIYPYAYIYDGKCEVTTFTATSIPFTPASWVSGKMAAAVESEVRKAGGRIMEMRVYVDENLLRPWTNWRIEVVTRPEITGVAMSLSGLWWLGLAIILALTAVIIIATPWAIKTIMALFKRNPALKDVKPGWKKETLILTIQDSEEYWKRTPTPVETLEAMTEEELREYLDKIAEEEVPLATGLGLAIAAVGVLGLGALAVMAMSMGKPRE